MELISQKFFIKLQIKLCHFSVLFSHSVVSDSVTPWTTACQASLSLTSSRSLPKFKSIESVMPSNHLIFCHPLLFLPSIFPSTYELFPSGDQSMGASASTSILPMNIQRWFPLGLTGLISLMSEGLSTIFFATILPTLLSSF